MSNVVSFSDPKTKDPIPKEWLSASVLQKRIIGHWTVTGYQPDEECIGSYHLIIGYDKNTGKVTLHRGESNLDEPSPHTYAFNSAIGVSIACLGGYVSQGNPGLYPLREDQWDLFLRVVDQLRRTYDIPVKPSAILMHGEVTRVLGVDQYGKWDIGWVPHLKLNTPELCGSAMREFMLHPDADVGVKIRISGKPVVFEDAFLFDGSTFVAIRSFIEAMKPEVSLDIKGLHLPTMTLSYSSGDGYSGFVVTVRAAVRNGVGYVSLKELLSPLGWGITVEKWDKDRKILVAAPIRGK